MNWSVKADFPTPPLPTIITLWSAGCWFGFFDMMSPMDMFSTNDKCWKIQVTDEVMQSSIAPLAEFHKNICHQNNRIHWFRYTSISTPIIWLGHTILTKHYASYRWWAFSDPVLRARGSYVVTVTHSYGTPEICMEGTQHGNTSIRLLPQFQTANSYINSTNNYRN